MPSLSSDLLRQIPKADLHCHLDGSLRAETLLELGRDQRVSLPATDAQHLAEFMRVDDARHLEDYLERFAITLSVMQRADALERITYELLEDAAREGTRYVEVRYAPVLNTEGGLTLGEAVEAPLRAIARAEREHDVRGRLIICALRQLSPDISLELARLAVAYRDRGVVGFDLAGGERGFPASAHLAAFDYAREHELAVTVHAGEGAGSESVRDAVHRCCANRIGHGTRLHEDAGLTEYVNDRRIALEVCLTSNVQTRAAASYDSHPLRGYFDRGLNVVLNTDNRLMSGTTLVDEYLHAARHLGFTFQELARVALNGFESAFIPWRERSALIERVRAELVSLGAKL